MASVEVRFDDIGVNGVVSDEDAGDLDHRSLSAARNMVLFEGVPSSVRALPRYPTDYVDTGTKFTSICKLEDPAKVHASVPTTGVLGKFREYSSGVQSAESGVFSGAGNALPLIRYGGETLWFDQSGVYPVMRWAGLGAMTYTSDSGTLTNGESAFDGPDDPAVRVGMYIGVSTASIVAQPSFRVEFKLPNGNGRLSDVYDGPSASSYIKDEFGYLGLHVPVREAKLSRTGTSPDVLSITTAGYSMVESGRLRAPVIPTIDYVGLKAAADRAAIISASTWDTLTLWAGASAQTASASMYQITRNMTGRCGALHSGRLYVASPVWMPNAVFEFPAGYEMGRMYNGVDSPATNHVQARIAKHVHIPDPDSPGRVVALLSTGAYLLALRTDSVYSLNGSYPNWKINLLWQADGCADVRSAVQSSWGQIWAGYNDIYLHDRGGIMELTKGRRQREYQHLIQKIMADSDPTVSCTVVGKYLLVAFAARAQSGVSYATTWVFDLALRVWCGDLVDLDAPAGMKPVFFSGGAFVHADSGLSFGANEITANTFLQPDFADQQRGFQIETGAVAGVGDNDRLTNVKVTYQLVNGSDPDATASLGVNVIGQASETSDSLTGVTVAGGRPRSARLSRGFTAVPHVSGGPGLKSNQVALRFTDTSTGPVSVMRVHGFKAVVRKVGRRV